MKMMAIGIDSYNQCTWEELIPSLRSAEGGDTKPKVLIMRTDEDINERADDID